ncbi:MAG: repeat protein, partial [Verrucomicrobiales bacterium]|nr:repeat protein [Verrucomicrobiales bacterium]
MKNLRQLISFCLLTITAFAVHAQGTAFNYQGKLSNGGNPANGSYDLTFALYATSSNGVAMAGPVTNSATSVTNGLFTTTIDFGAGVFTGTSYWLEIGVRLNGGGSFATLSPRQAVTPTPYAIKSVNADTAVVASNFNGIISAGQVSGTLSLNNLPAAVLTNNASGVNLAGIFSGNGAAITNIDLRNVDTRGGVVWSTNYLSTYLTNQSAMYSFVFNSSNNLSGNAVMILPVDVDTDGKLDLVTVHSGLLSILKNNGDGTFFLASTKTVGSFAVAVVAADVNGDNKPDLVSANFSGNSLSILTNDGTGAFTLSSTKSVGTGPQSVAAGDINGDGSVDLVTASSFLSNNTLTVCTNNGSGIFTTAATINSATPRCVRIVDVNMDGKLDMVVANGSANMLTVYTNNGAGVFTVLATIPIGANAGFFVASDVNLDGKPDVVTANSGANTLTVLTNDGSGGFITTCTPAVGTGPNSVALMDVNSDGKVDLISGNTTAGTVSVLTNGGGGLFTHAFTQTVNTNGINYVAAAQLDGNNGGDLVTLKSASAAASLSIYLSQQGTDVVTNTYPDSYDPVFVGNGSGLTNLNASAVTNGTLPLAQLPPAVVLDNETGVTLTGTFSGNGAGISNVDLRTAKTQGGIFFTTNSNIGVNSSMVVGVLPRAVTAVDVNNDGWIDLVSASSSVNTLSILTNDGHAGFTLSSSPGVGNTPYSIAAADINNDGKVDLITANYGANTLTILTNNGSGGFVLSSSPTVGNAQVAVISADMNGDGKPDLISADSNFRRLMILTNNGSGVFTLQEQPSLNGAIPVAVAAADVNSDGRMDLITVNSDTGRFTVLTNGPGQFGNFEITGNPPAGLSPTSLVAADINGDGKPDLISTSYQDNLLSIVTNDGYGGFVLSSSPAVGSGPRAVVAADLNSDGSLDLISANALANTLTLLTNNGHGIF